MFIIRSALSPNIAGYNQTSIIESVIGLEGGYSNNPNDPGGETNWGITAAAIVPYRDYLTGVMGWDGQMISLTKSQAVYVYIKEYWDPMDLDNIMAQSQNAPLLADLLFEAGVNLGTGTIVGMMQQCLNVLNYQQRYYSDITVDGVAGDATLGALQGLFQAHPTTGLPNLLFMMSALVGARYIAIAANNSSQEEWEDGWQNRARDQYNAYASILGNV